jgi:predicted Zn finger-like uncharacterized protein
MDFGPALGVEGLPALAAQNYNLPRRRGDAQDTGTRRSVIIACPSCEARFNLDPAKLLPAGRNVRCAKCGHRWRQMPEGEAAAEAVPETPPAPDSTAAAAAEPAATEEAETHPPSPPTSPAEMAQSLAQIAEQVTGQLATKDEGAGEAAEANPIARLTRRAASSGSITMPPRLRPMRPAKRNTNLGLVLAAGLVVGLLIAGYVFRDVIARTVPGAGAIYSLLGFSTSDRAVDLEISNILADVSTDEKTGKKVLDLTATVFNPSEHPVERPTLALIPLDDVGSHMQPMRFRLAESVVEPGQNIKFRKSFEDWPSTATEFMLEPAGTE